VIAWQEKIVRMLIEGGEHGVRLSFLTWSVDKAAQPIEVRSFLESLRADHAAQKFRDGKFTYWRATDLLPTLFDSN
jgi:hypothetical protein